MRRSGSELNEPMPAGYLRRIAVIRFLTGSEGAAETVGETVAREKTGLDHTRDETVRAGGSGSGGLDARGRYQHDEGEESIAAD